MPMMALVVTIDDFELHLGATVYGPLLAVLERVLPRVQWILTTSSPFAAAQCPSHQLVRLRKQPQSDQVILYEGELAITH